MSALYRENVRISEEMVTIAKSDDGVLAKLSILKALGKSGEEVSEPVGARGSSRGSAMDFDGPADSPGPSPAEVKQIRKLGTGRTSSQPPRDTPARGEADEKESVNPGRTKITFAMGQEVAFRPKISGATEEHDWIQGVVVKVIGEGKSRRYDVRDPFPEGGGDGEVYRSSASSMVPVPPEGTHLPDYELGKRVLALYPDTTTFYRAEVKATLDGGRKLELLFDEEAQGKLQIQDRRYVLDHRG